jgi:hypothetical protein
MSVVAHLSLVTRRRIAADLLHEDQLGSTPRHSGGFPFGRFVHVA